jgi:lysophospholipase L1-like esterase
MRLCYLSGMYWYEEDVKHLERKITQLGYAPDTVFYGSSTIRLWETLYDDFKDWQPLNLGFGGSTLAACVWFFDRIMQPINPKRLIIYAGDNDLGDGRTAEEVFIFFQALMAKVERRFGQIPCYYLSLKPSPSRWHIIDQYKYANNLIESEIIKQQNNWHFINIFKPMLNKQGMPQPEYFAADQLHLSAEGYQVWKDVVSHFVNGG